MIRENRQEILQYLKEHNIEVTPTIKKTLSKNQVIWIGDYLAFQFGDHFIELYFEFPSYRTDAMRKFLRGISRDITTDEFWSYVGLITRQCYGENEREVVEAILIKEIREDKETLNLIVNQDNWVKKHVVKEAALIKEIREDKKLLNLIANQGTWEEQEQFSLEIQKILEEQKKGTATKEFLEERKNILNSILKAQYYDEFMEWYKKQEIAILKKVKNNYN